MRLTVLGRSPARPNPGEACAGYLVEGGGSRILMDVGPGVVAQLLRRNTPDELDAVVISHMHTDHCLDLVTLRYSYPWIDVAKHRLTVIVPPGSIGQLSELALGAGYANFFTKASSSSSDGQPSNRQPPAGAGRPTTSPGAALAAGRRGWIGSDLLADSAMRAFTGWPTAPNCSSARRPCAR
jgi:ribonuclease BN (tRNA processing enzyme)